jgi:membrane-associated phospholipid phosphatase
MYDPSRRCFGTRTAAAAFALFLETLAATVMADPLPDSEPSPFEVDARVEIPIVLVAGLGAMLPRVFVEELGPTSCHPNCDPNHVNEFDRWVIGNHSETAGAISDVAFFSSLALPYAFTALDAGISQPPDGITGYLKDNLVLLETMLFTLATVNATQFVFARPRPLVYDAEHFTEEERYQDTHMLSFPGGHTAAGFAMATTYGWIYMRRHPESPWIVPIWLGGYSLATINGYARVAAGEHFLSDVLVGAAMGTGIGLAVPFLHDRVRERANHASILSRFRLSPLSVPGGVGAMLTVE